MHFQYKNAGKRKKLENFSKMSVLIGFSRDFLNEKKKKERKSNKKAN